MNISINYETKSHVDRMSKNDLYLAECQSAAQAHSVHRTKSKKRRFWILLVISLLNRHRGVRDQIQLTKFRSDEALAKCRCLYRSMNRIDWHVLFDSIG